MQRSADAAAQRPEGSASSGIALAEQSNVSTRWRGPMFRLFRKKREEGASAVEFALVLPIFILLVFGIMEAGWVFSQQVEVRNAAREGARLAVVDYADAATMRAEVCQRAALSNDRARVSFTLNGDTAEVRAEQTYASLTGVIPAFNGGIVISSVAEMRLEREIGNWGNSVLTDCPTSP
ncbi:MAG: TadE family protein [Actinomycetota bacterium]